MKKEKKKNKTRRKGKGRRNKMPLYVTTPHY